MHPHQLVAHRGYCARAPENTRSAILAAIEVGALFIEIDIQFSRDCQPLVYHDVCLSRVSGIDEPNNKVVTRDIDDLSRLPAHEPKRLSDSFKSEKIASLRSLWPIFEQYPDITFFLEIKPEGLMQFSHDALFHALEAHRLKFQQQLVIISFDYSLIELASTHHWPVTGIVLNSWSHLQGREIKRILPTYIFIDKKILPSIEALGVVGARTVVYEVDDPIEAQTLISAGAEMVETFDIGKLLTAKC